MIDAEREAEVKALLASGMKVYEVARETHTARDTVYRIQRGEPKKYTGKSKRKPEIDYALTAAWRCPSCGGKVKTRTCVLCGIRKPRATVVL